MRCCLQILEELVHRARHAGKMDSDYGTCARSNTFLYFSWIEHHGERIDVCKYRDGVLPEDRENGANIRNRRHNHLVSGLEIERGECQVDTCGAT